MMSNVMYTIRESARARTIRVTVYPSGEVVVTRPKGTSGVKVERFVKERRDWIEKAQEKFARRRKREAKNPPIDLPRVRKGSKAYKETVEKARELAHKRLTHFAPQYGFTYGRVGIRNQKSRWGCCSEKGNLNFNYKIVFLPSELADYILVHELCHLKEMNHSVRFWNLVARAIPNHVTLRKELQRYPLG